MLSQTLEKPTEAAQLPHYINAATTSNTVRVYAEAIKGTQKQIFDVLLDAGSPIKPRLVALLVGWAITDWMPDGVF